MFRFVSGLRVFKEQTNIADLSNKESTVNFSRTSRREVCVGSLRGGLERSGESTILNKDFFPDCSATAALM